MSSRGSPAPVDSPSCRSKAITEPAKHRDASYSHVGDVDDSLVAEARGPEINALLFAELEVLPAALARQERGEHVLRDADPFVLQVQPICSRNRQTRNKISRSMPISSASDVANKHGMRATRSVGQDSRKPLGRSRVTVQ